MADQQSDKWDQHSVEMLLRRLGNCASPGHPYGADGARLIFTETIDCIEHLLMRSAEGNCITVPRNIFRGDADHLGRPTWELDVKLIGETLDQAVGRLVAPSPEGTPASSGDATKALLRSNERQCSCDSVPMENCPVHGDGMGPIEAPSSEGTSKPVAWLNADGQTVLSEVKRQEMAAGPFAWAIDKHWKDATPLYLAPSATLPRMEKIDLSKGEKHEHPDINAEDHYLAKFSDGWWFGTFSREWYGWTFDCGFGVCGSYQFDAPGSNGSSWQELYRVTVDSRSESK